MIREAKPVELVRAGMAWEVIEPGPPRSEPWVTINVARKTLDIPAATFELMGRPETALVLFSREHSSIGIAPCALDAKEAFYLADKRGTRERGNCKRIKSKRLGVLMETLGHRGTYRLLVHWDESGVLWGDLTDLKRSVGRPPGSGKTKGNGVCARASAGPTKGGARATDSAEIGE